MKTRNGRASARTLGASLAACAVLLPLVLAADDNKPISKADFMAAFNGPDSTAAGKAVERLDPDNKDHYELLRTVLGATNTTWYLRAKAAERLAKTANDANTKDMVSRLSEKTEKSAMVRQGMVIAIAKMKDPKNLPALHATLSDKDGRVRREAAFRIRQTVKAKSSIDALIARWKDEQDPIVASFIRETLEDMTLQFLGPQQEAWSRWWSEHKEGYKLAESDEEQKKAKAEFESSEAARKAEEEGKKFAPGTTRSKDVDLDFVARGKGIPILVIPPYAVSKEVFIPFFIDLERDFKVCYMDLPKIKSFKSGVESSASGTPIYPLNAFVDAFEEFRKAQKVEKFVILSSGTPSWIAMRYATKNPKNVLALIFVSPVASDKDFDNATKRMIAQGKATNDVELEHYAMERNTIKGKSVHDDWHEKNKVPKPEGEDEALERRKWTCYFGDPQDTLLDLLFPRAWNHPGECSYPEFKPENETPVQVPTLVACGAKSLFSSMDDCTRVAKVYGSAVVSFDKSSDFPFIDEPDKFKKTIKSFLVKNVPPPKAEKGGDKK